MGADAAGAATGAASGAAMGTMVLPGIGTAIGAVAGGLFGAFGSSKPKKPKDDSGGGAPAGKNTYFPTTDKYGHKITIVKAADGSSIELANSASIFGDQKFLIFASMAAIAVFIFAVRTGKK